MQINVIFINPEIFCNLKNKTYNIPEGSTVRDLLEIIKNEEKIDIKDEYLKWIVYLADGKPAHLNTVLDGVKTVHMLRAVVGG